MFCELSKCYLFLLILKHFCIQKNLLRPKNDPHTTLLCNCVHIVHANNIFLFNWCVIVFQVFTCDNPGAFKSIYSPNSQDKKKTLETLADQLVTLCATLDEYPGVRYKKWAKADLVSQHITHLSPPSRVTPFTPDHRTCYLTVAGNNQKHFLFLHKIQFSCSHNMHRTYTHSCVQKQCSDHIKSNKKTSGQTKQTLLKVQVFYSSAP